MSSKLIVNKIDGDLVLSKEIFLKTNLEDEMQELGFVGEEIFPEISTCQEIWNIGYVEPIKRDSGKLLINITTDENALVLNIDKCIKTIKKHKNEKKQNQEMILVDRICNNLAKNAQQSANITHIEKNVWEDSKTITLDETYEKWDYRIKNIEKMNEKIKINMKVLNLIRSGEYKELFSNKPFKCTECKIGFKSVNELRDHVDEYGDYKLTNGNWENNAYFKNEELTTFKLSRNECEMCHSNIVVIIKQQNDDIAKLFCNRCSYECPISIEENENDEGPTLCYICGKINDDGPDSCDGIHEIKIE